MIYPNLMQYGSGTFDDFFGGGFFPNPGGYGGWYDPWDWWGIGLPWPGPWPIYYPAPLPPPPVEAPMPEPPPPSQPPPGEELPPYTGPVEELPETPTYPIDVPGLPWPEGGGELPPWLFPPPPPIGGIPGATPVPPEAIPVPPIVGPPMPLPEGNWNPLTGDPTYSIDAVAREGRPMPRPVEPPMPVPEPPIPVIPPPPLPQFPAPGLPLPGREGRPIPQQPSDQGTPPTPTPQIPIPDIPLGGGGAPLAGNYAPVVGSAAPGTSLFQFAPRNKSVTSLGQLLAFLQPRQ